MQISSTLLLHKDARCARTETSSSSLFLSLFFFVSDADAFTPTPFHSVRHVRETLDLEQRSFNAWGEIVLPRKKRGRKTCRFSSHPCMQVYILHPSSPMLRMFFFFSSQDIFIADHRCLRGNGGRRTSILISGPTT